MPLPENDVEEIDVDELLARIDCLEKDLKEQNEKISAQEKAIQEIIESVDELAETLGE